MSNVNAAARGEESCDGFNKDAALCKQTPWSCQHSHLTPLPVRSHGPAESGSVEGKTLIRVWLRGAGCNATLAQPNMDGQHASELHICKLCLWEHGQLHVGSPRTAHGRHAAVVGAGNACGDSLGLGHPMQLVCSLSNQTRTRRPGSWLGPCLSYDSPIIVNFTNKGHAN